MPVASPQVTQRDRYSGSAKTSQCIAGVFIIKRIFRSSVAPAFYISVGVNRVDEDRCVFVIVSFRQYAMLAFYCIIFDKDYIRRSCVPQRKPTTIATCPSSPCIFRCSPSGSKRLYRLDCRGLLSVCEAICAVDFCCFLRVVMCTSCHIQCAARDVLSALLFPEHKAIYPFAKIVLSSGALLPGDFLRSYPRPLFFVEGHSIVRTFWQTGICVPPPSFSTHMYAPGSCSLSLPKSISTTGPKMMRYIASTAPAIVTFKDSHVQALRFRQSHHT